MVNIQEFKEFCRIELLISCVIYDDALILETYYTSYPCLLSDCFIGPLQLFIYVYWISHIHNYSGRPNF